MHEFVWPEGKLAITEAALATVVSAAVLRCPGVVALGPPRLGDELVGFLRDSAQAREAAHREPEVTVESGRCLVTVQVVLAFGVHIESVCREIVQAVGAELARSAGIPRSVVDVRVVGVRETAARPLPR